MDSKIIFPERFFGVFIIKIYTGFVSILYDKLIYALNDFKVVYLKILQNYAIFINSVSGFTCHIFM